jgi:hypothetical protein
MATAIVKYKAAAEQVRNDGKALTSVSLSLPARGGNGLMALVSKPHDGLRAPWSSLTRTWCPTGVKLDGWTCSSILPIDRGEAHRRNGS